MLKQLFVTVLFLNVTLLAMAQKPDSVMKPKPDTAVVKRDTVVRTSYAPKIKKEKIYHPDSTHIPSLAVKRSLIIPGWGQVYNHKIWKVPFIYAGLVSLGAAVIYNNNYYKQFLALAKINKTGSIPKQGEPLYASYIKYKTEYDQYASLNVGYDALANASDGYLRNRDLSILGILAVWGIQAVEAYIDAKFISSYSVDNDLSFKVSPGFINQPVYAANFNNAYIPGIKITFTLK